MKKPIVSNQIILLAFAIVFIFLAGGCFFYKVHTASKLVYGDVEAFNKKQKYYMLHTADTVWHMKCLDLRHDTIFATLEPFWGHQKYKTTNKQKANRYKYYKHEQDVIHEIHLYTSLKIDKPLSVAIAAKDISNVEIYEIDLASTIPATIATTVGISLFTAGVGVLLVLMLKQSCPFVYVSNGSDYKFCGEIYSGAIHKPLERHDYLPLTGIAPDNGYYKLKITNEVKEMQFTNFTELMIFDHAANAKVLVDKYGKEHAFCELQKPAMAHNLEGENVISSIMAEDTISYTKPGVADTTSLTDGIILTFNIPDSAKKLNLTVKAKNSLWLDYAFGKFYDMFGIAYNAWQDRQDSVSKQELLKWGLEQNIPLMVYVKKHGQWVYTDNFNVIGPMAYKEDILPLQLDSATDKPLQIKLEYGMHFWEIDYVGLDIQRDLTVTKTIAPVITAFDENNKDISTLLAAEDGQYYRQPEIGNKSMLTFKVPAKTNASRTVILHSKGYYRILRNPSGIPDRKYLEKFKNPGSFNKFSNDLFRFVKTLN